MIRLQQRFKILRPLSIRDFALLWTGLSVSMIGDGVTYVALAWQVYELSNIPTAMSVVGVAWTLPMLLFLLVGGVVSDRFDRRRVMVLSDVVRGSAVALIGVLSVTGRIELWHILVLIALYGSGEAFFGPAFGAIVPDIVPRSMLVQANSLEQFVRPVAFQLLGPALGGFAIAVFEGAGAGVGPVFLVDAASFAFSALCLGAMQSRPRPHVRDAKGGGPTAALREIGEGFRFVRSQTWLWATLCMALFALLFFLGPFEVLLPYIVKNKLNGGADVLGLVFAAGGVGAIFSSILMAQRGLPRRHMVVMYLAFGFDILSVAGYAFVTQPWQAMAIAFAGGGSLAVGMIVWGTLMHKLVPVALQGRVRSVDWLVSIGLVPVSFAITGPIAGLIGVSTTLVGAGVLGGIATVVFMLVPGLYDTEGDPRLRDTHEDGIEVDEREPVATAH
jgi:DHA3 family tetracycline resistance protein-like MFS transporter